MTTETKTDVAVFGAGCFWGTERYLKKEFGNALTKVQVGYMGGASKINEPPTYKQVCSGTTGHAEVCRVEFDPAKANYAKMVEHFFRFHDPTTLNKQGNDRGSQYRSVIFTFTDEQAVTAKDVMTKVQQQHYKNTPIVTEIVPAKDHTFYAAEEYHQAYLDANPGGYCNHRLRW